MINVLIVDDEKPARDEMMYLLQNIENINIAGIAKTGDEALLMAMELKPDLIFLDIKMAELNGFEVAEKLHKNRFFPSIIFTTAYDQYALKAFDINALDYILKPVDRDRLISGIGKFTAQTNRQSDRDYNSINNLLKELQQHKSPNKFISILQGASYTPVLQDNVISISAKGRDVSINALEGEFCHSKSIGEMEEILCSEKFFRCHRSHIININHIEKIDIWFNNTFQIEMKNSPKKIIVSRSYIGRFRELMSIV